MSDLQKLIAWLASYKEHDILGEYKVDYTDKVPSTGAVFPQGLVEIKRIEDVLGNVTVQNQYNFALYMDLPHADGDDVGAQINADWVMDFQRWMQGQSVTHKAPTFGDVDQRSETIAAQNGVLYDADGSGMATYMIQISAKFKVYYPAE